MELFNSSVLSFKANLDSFWINQEVYYKCKYDIVKMAELEIKV